MINLSPSNFSSHRYSLPSGHSRFGSNALASIGAIGLKRFNDDDDDDTEVNDDVRIDGIDDSKNDDDDDDDKEDEDDDDGSGNEESFVST